jgi:hypothetical protein
VKAKVLPSQQLYPQQQQKEKAKLPSQQSSPKQ